MTCQSCEALSWSLTKERDVARRLMGEVAMRDKKIEELRIALIDTTARLGRDTAALRAELVATLRESVAQGCYFYGGSYHSNGIGTYADQLRRLAELGEAEIISDHGHVVVARWRKG